MTPGEIVVVLVLTAVVGLAVRSLWKSHRSGGGCSGCCSECCNGDHSHCSSCHPK